MGAIKLCFWRQCFQTLQTGPELRRCAFEHAPAAQRKQRIADKGDGTLWQVIGDVAQRVPADIDDLRGEGAQ